MKKVGILGSGIVGQTLANGFLKYGYEVMVGTRDLTKLTEWKENAGEKGQIGSFSDSAAFGSILVLAVKGSIAINALEMAGDDNLKNKTIIDATNPIADAPPDNGVIKYFTGPNQSLMEQYQETYPNAHFVKAFSCIGNAKMVNPDYHGQKPTMFICGNNADAKTEVSSILDLFGFDIADMGSIEAARAIEPLAMLWCIPGLINNQWDHAFKLIKP